MENPDDRKAWIEALSKAPADALRSAFAGTGPEPRFSWLREPEIAAMMVRGRTGATGDAFNLGEMTVTRCSLKLDDGSVGHAYVPGRDNEKARIAAICDGLMQGPRADEIRAAVIAPMSAITARQRTDLAARADTTRVDFFTMVRGENS